MNKIISTILVGIAMLSMACQKELSSADVTSGTGTGTGTGTGNPATTGTEIKRIQQGVHPDLTKDTVWLLTYTPSKKISKIYDSLYNYDSMTATYDVADRLVEVNSAPQDYIRITYDAAGLLTQVNYYWAGSRERYLVEYNGNNISKTTYLSDLGSGGAFQTLGYETYTVTDGNITEVRQFSTGGTLQAQATLTYGTQANPFKNLSLFNFANRLGMDQIVNFYTYFNKNISSGARIGPLTFKTNNTFTNQKLTKVISEDFFGSGGSFTWTFSY